MLNVNKKSMGKKYSYFKSVVLFIILILMSVGAYAESDSGTFLANKEPASAGNIYLQIEPLKLQFPMVFAGFKEEKVFSGMLTNVGVAVSGEIGYNWGGWLFGAHVGYSAYKAMNNEPFIQSFENLTVGFNLSRVLSSRTFKKLPTWLEFTPFIGLGADLYKAKYYRTLTDKENQTNLHEHEFKDKPAFYMRGGLQMNFYFNTDYAIPFIGLEGNIVPDKNGMSFFSSMSLGLRVYPFSGLGKRNALTEPAVYVFVSPDEKAENGYPVKLSFEKDLIKKDEKDDGNDIKEWTVIVCDAKGKELKKWTGEGDLPESLEWDGKNEAGELIAPDADFIVKTNTSLKNGKKLTDETLTVKSKEQVKPSLALSSSENEITPYGKALDTHIKLNLDAKNLEKDSVKYWAVEILDKNNKVVRTIKGRGQPPATVKWDGRDNSGKPVLARSVYTVRTSLKLKDASVALAETKIKTGNPIVKLNLAKKEFDPKGEKESLALNFATQGLSDENLKSWTVIIYNAKGKAVRTLKGNGMPPAKLSWDGKDEKGNLVPSGEAYKIISDFKLTDGSHTTTQEKVRIAVPKGETDIVLDLSSDEFTPDGDGVNDTLGFVVKAKNIENPEKEVKDWNLSIYDSYNKLFKEMKGEGLPPKDLSWDGKGENGESVVSAKTYRADMTVNLANGQKISKSADIETGILVKKDEVGQLRIQVTSISFDPSAATFNKISAEKIASNEKTLREVAEVIKKYKGYSVTVEGHANPTSKGAKAIERENKKYLIPLSQARAEAIKEKLIELGVSKNQLTKVIGMGGNRLVAEPFGDNRWKNRRVEFILTKN